MNEMWEDLERETPIENAAKPVILGNPEVVKYVWRKIVSDVAVARRAETKKLDELFGLCDGAMLAEGTRTSSRYEEIDLTIPKIRSAWKY